MQRLLILRIINEIPNGLEHRPHAGIVFLPNPTVNSGCHVLKTTAAFQLHTHREVPRTEQLHP
jgi:hypothetical protein